MTFSATVSEIETSWNSPFSLISNIVSYLKMNNCNLKLTTLQRCDRISWSLSWEDGEILHYITETFGHQVVIYELVSFTFTFTYFKIFTSPGWLRIYKIILFWSHSRDHFGYAWGTCYIDITIRNKYLTFTISWRNEGNHQEYKYWFQKPNHAAHSVGLKFHHLWKK